MDVHVFTEPELRNLLIEVWKQGRAAYADNLCEREVQEHLNNVKFHRLPYRVMDNVEKAMTDMATQLDDSLKMAETFIKDRNMTARLKSHWESSRNAIYQVTRHTPGYQPALKALRKALSKERA